MFAEDISEDFSDLTFTGFYSISGYLRNLRGRLLSSERFSEVFTLWVFTLKPFPASARQPLFEPLLKVLQTLDSKRQKHPFLPQELAPCREGHPMKHRLRYRVLRGSDLSTRREKVPYPPVFTQTCLCDTPFCNISRDSCAMPQKHWSALRNLPLPHGLNPSKTMVSIIL